MATDEHDQDDLVITPIPSLVAVLLNMENSKGTALTKEEVLDATENCECKVLTREQHAKVVARRGYEDIDPEYAWEDWLSFRSANSTAET
jgi:hypothetical protein